MTLAERRGEQGACCLEKEFTDRDDGDSRWLPKVSHQCYFPYGCVKRNRVWWLVLSEKLRTLLGIPVQTDHESADRQSWVYGKLFNRGDCNGALNLLGQFGTN